MTVRLGSPIVGEGKVKSMLGGGSCKIRTLLYVLEPLKTTLFLIILNLFLKQFKKCYIDIVYSFVSIILICITFNIIQ